MLTKERCLELVYESLGDINAGRAPEFKVVLQPDTKLLGEEGSLSSLDVVDLIVKVEEELSVRLNRQVTLLDEQLLCQESPPLRDIASLAGFLESNFFE